MPFPVADRFLEAQVLSVFTLAKIPIEKLWRLPNQYISYQDGEDDETTTREAIYRAQRPWWLVKTPWGLIEMGPRKRVFNIDWEDTKFKATYISRDATPEGSAIEKTIVGITADDVTKGEFYVHAYSIAKMIEYLTELGEALRAAKTADDAAAADVAKEH